jgi:hypothetical protein
VSRPPLNSVVRHVRAKGQTITADRKIVKNRQTATDYKIDATLEIITADNKKTRLYGMCQHDV